MCKEKPMIRKIGLIFPICMFLVLGACHKQYTAQELGPDIKIGDVYYTQFSLFQENNVYRTTNYRRGLLIPINTSVTLVSIGDKDIELRLNDSGQKLIIENVAKHTNEDSQQAFRKILGKKKVDLSAFTGMERENILIGQVKKGMSKKAVLAALGYPPAIQTPSLEGDDWTYWSSRFDRFIVRFQNGKVESIIE